MRALGGVLLSNSSKRTPCKKTKRQEFGDFQTVRSSKRTKRGVKIVVKKNF
jgi:hypothetical protein